MVDYEIHELVRIAIQENDTTLLNEKCLLNNSREQYVYDTAVRLINIWIKQKRNIAFKVDFECSLRNYLLLMKTELFIKDYIPSEHFYDFGLNLEESTGRIWATMLLPSFSNKQLVKKMYMQDWAEEKRDTIHNLLTNGFIQKLTGFTKFKSNEQKLAVMGALRVPAGYSCLVSMTTGGGKSLITQTVAYQKEGLTLVVVPTISLMLDQYQNACEVINRDSKKEIFYYHSACDLTRFFDSLEKKTARILFVSPESLIKNQQLRDRILKANDEKYLKNIIIDEAHIIIEWGSSFRIDFQCLDAMRKNFMLVNKELRTFLLSATYSDETIRQLKMFYSDSDRWIEIRCEKLRHETRFDIIKCDSFHEKDNKILQAIDLLPRPMIVYVKSPDLAEQLRDKLSGIGYNNVFTFTGSTANEQRQEIIDLWKNGQFDLMIATCAFGVGVDKKDVRTVLHTYVPENPNKYYQEAGRGGRDGLPSLSTMIYTEQDVDSAFSFVSKVITTEKLMGRWFSMLNSGSTQPLHNSKYMIDTYVKPDYNIDEEFIDSISNQDINWNVYVILFLRRNGLVSIDDIQYMNNKYVFYITVLERKILFNNDETKVIIDKLRNLEWKKNEYEFFLMKNNLKKVGKCCWSDMFTKIYRKTSDYCAGCNEHVDIIDFEDNKTLKLNINSPLVVVSDEIKSYTYCSGVTLIISENYDQINEIVMKGLNVLVADNETFDAIGIKQIDNKELLLCSYYDFIELISENKYYISGSILIYFPDDVGLQKKIISIIEKYSSKYNIEFLLYSKEDYSLPFKNKNLSEIVQRCKEHL